MNRIDIDAAIADSVTLARTNLFPTRYEAFDNPGTVFYFEPDSDGTWFHCRRDGGPAKHPPRHIGGGSEAAVFSHEHGYADASRDLEHQRFVLNLHYKCGKYRDGSAQGAALTVVVKSWAAVTWALVSYAWAVKRAGRRLTRDEVCSVREQAYSADSGIFTAPWWVQEAK